MGSSADDPGGPPHSAPGPVGREPRKGVRATGCWPRQPCWYARAAAERCGWPRRALRLRLRGAASSAEAKMSKGRMARPNRASLRRRHLPCMHDEDDTISSGVVEV